MVSFLIDLLSYFFDSVLFSDYVLLIVSFAFIAVSCSMIYKLLRGI